MNLLALLITTDDSAAEILGRVLPASGIAVERFSDLSTAIARLQQQRFDALVIDYENPEAAAEVFEETRALGRLPRRGDDRVFRRRLVLHAAVLGGRRREGAD